MPDRIPTVVLSSLGFDLVELHALSRHDKVEAPSRIIERVENKSNPVVATQRISVSQMSSNGRGIWIVAAKSCV